MSKLFIKICGITRAEEAKAIADLGVDAIGMILHADSPRTISFEIAQTIRRVVPSSIKLVGVVVNASHTLIDTLVDQIDLDLVQLHGNEEPSFAKQLTIPYKKAIRPRTLEQSVKEIAAFPDAQAVLLDPYVEGQYGGTGHTLNTELWPAHASKPLILAGGLNVNNVMDRVVQLSPWGVDLNSGVEVRAGQKDLVKVARAVERLRGSSEAT